MAKLGRHKRGVGCLYIKKLDDIDRGALSPPGGAEGWLSTGRAFGHHERFAN